MSSTPGPPSSHENASTPESGQPSRKKPRRGQRPTINDRLRNGGSGGKSSKDPNAGDPVVNVQFCDSAAGKTRSQRPFRGRRLPEPDETTAMRGTQTNTHLRQIARDDTVLGSRLAQHGYREFHLGKLHEHNAEHQCCRHCANDSITSALCAFAKEFGVGDDAARMRAIRFARGWIETHEVPSRTHESEQLFGCASRFGTTCSKGHDATMLSSPMLPSGSYEINERYAIASLLTGIDARKLEAIRACKNMPTAQNYVKHSHHESVVRVGPILMRKSEASIHRGHQEEAMLERWAARLAGWEDGIFCRAILRRRDKRRSKKRKRESTIEAKWLRRHKQALVTREEAALGRKRGEGDAYGHGTAIIGRADAGQCVTRNTPTVPCDICGKKFFTKKIGMLSSTHRRKCKAARESASSASSAVVPN